ncbi:MAG: hypothetical protein PVI66_13640 [Candidatus Aminicenantes bacterium]|jgi:hypothetical protein
MSSLFILGFDRRVFFIDRSEWDSLCLNSELNVFTIRPALAIKIAEYLSIGAGLDIIRSNVRWDFHNIHSTIFYPDRDWVINELKARRVQSQINPSSETSLLMPMPSM